MLKSLKITLIIFSLSLIFILAVLAYPLFAAEKNLPLGSRCQHSHECSRFYNGFEELGCRQSDLGDYKICKIVSSGTAGCSQVPDGEQWCGDGMVCRNDKCRLMYGVDDFPEIDTSVFSTEMPSSAQAFEFGVKIINIIFNFVLIIGLVLFLKGYMIYKTSFGHEPLNHKAYKFMIIGGAVMLLSLGVWQAVESLA